MDPRILLIVEAVLTLGEVVERIARRSANSAEELEEYIAKRREVSNKLHEVIREDPADASSEDVSQKLLESDEHPRVPGETEQSQTESGPNIVTQADLEAAAREAGEVADDEPVGEHDLQPPQEQSDDADADQNAG